MSTPDTTLALLRRLKPPSLTALAGDARIMEAATTLVASYYYILPFAAFIFAGNHFSARQNFEPVWSLAWVDVVSLEYGSVVALVRLAAVAISLLGVLWYRHRAVRILVFLMLFQIHAFESSFGAHNHQWNLWVYTSLVFVFLPDIWRPSVQGDTGRRFLLAIWTAQAVVALMYSMAGMQKILTGLQQHAIGEVSGFSVLGFAYHIAYWAPRLQEEVALGLFIIAHPVAGWIPFVAMIFIQFFSLWVMIRVGLHRIWAVVIVLFHIGTYFTMGISFHPLILLVIALFFYSPFAKERYSFREFVLDLPIVGQAVEWWGKRRATRVTG
jgi:hypothetical protein